MTKSKIVPISKKIMIIDSILKGKHIFVFTPLKYVCTHSVKMSSVLLSVQQNHLSPLHKNK